MTFRTSQFVVPLLTAAAFCGTPICGADLNAPPHVDVSGVNLQPPYPPTAIANLERGAVVLGVAVTAKGTATRVSLVQTSGFNDLDASAIATVLAWKFVPAMKDGAPVEGATMVKLVFEPPAATANAAGAQPPPPAPSKLLFPTPMTMSAADGKLEVQDYSVPCPIGEFNGSVTLEHDAKAGGEMVDFGVKLSAGSDTAQFNMHRIGSRLVGATITRGTNSGADTGSGYWGSGEMNIPIPISVVWGSGKVIGNGGKTFGAHEVAFGKDPQQLELEIYSGDVTLTNAQLVCLPP